MIDIVSSVKHYQPVFWNVDNSKLLESNRSNILYANEQNEKAQQKAEELATVIGSLKFHESMGAEKQKLTAELDNMINSTLQNYGGNLRYAFNNIMQMSKDLVTNEKVKGLLETNKQYEDWVAAVKANPDIDADTKEFILNSSENQYHFDARVINNDGSETIINNWQPGLNDNIISYKNWQAGREPVAQQDYLKFAIDVIANLNKKSDQYTIRKFYDINGNELKGAQILNAAYYIDNDSNKVELSEQIISDAIEAAIEASPNIQASLRQDYDKALYFKNKGEDIYGVSQTPSSNLGYEQYVNKIFGKIAPAFAFKNTTYSNLPNILKVENDGSGNRTGGGNSDDDLRMITDYFHSVGTIKIDYSPDNTKNILEEFNRTVVSNVDNYLKNHGINVENLSTYDRLTKVKQMRNIIDDATYIAMVDNLTKVIDNENYITLYNQDLYNKLPDDQKAIISKVESINNGNLEVDDRLIGFYNNFFEIDNDGGTLDEKGFTFYDKTLSASIITLARQRGIKFENLGIRYNESDDTFTIPHTGKAFKEFSHIVYDAMNNDYGVTWKYIKTLWLDKANNYWSGTLHGASSNYIDIMTVLDAGNAFTRLKQEAEDIKIAAGTEVYRKSIDTHSIYDISYRALEMNNATDAQLNDAKRAIVDMLTTVDFSKYNVYVSNDITDYNGDKIDVYGNGIKKKDIRDGELILLDPSNREAITAVQNFVQTALSNKHITNTSNSTDINYSPNSYNNLQTGFADVANIGVGNYIKVPIGNKVYTVFLQTNSNDKEGLNDAQKSYINSNYYKVKQEVDALELGNNPIARTFDMGVNNIYKMGYDKNSKGDKYYIQYSNGDRQYFNSENMISFVNVRNEFKQLARAIRTLPDNVETTLRNAILNNGENVDTSLLQPYTNLMVNINNFVEYNMDIFQALNGNTNVSTIRRNILNDLVTYY